MPTMCSSVAVSVLFDQPVVLVLSMALGIFLGAVNLEIIKKTKTGERFLKQGSILDIKTCLKIAL